VEEQQAKEKYEAMQCANRKEVEREEKLKTVKKKQSSQCCSRKDYCTVITRVAQKGKK